MRESSYYEDKVPKINGQFITRTNSKISRHKGHAIQLIIPSEKTFSIRSTRSFLVTVENVNKQAVIARGISS